MPAKYHPVAPSIWDRTMRGLSPAAMVVRYYVQTCPHRVSEGLFQLPLGHLIHDTGLTSEQVDQGLAELAVADLVLYDDEAEVVLDCTALKYNPLRNGTVKDGPRRGDVAPDKRITSAVRLFEQVPETPLKAEFYCLAFEHSPDLAEPLAYRYPDLTFATGQGPSKGLPSPSEAPSREELSRDELSLRGRKCVVEQCKNSAAWRDPDGANLCGAHRHLAFGDVVPLADTG
jgi:hypothetical protein